MSITNKWDAYIALLKAAKWADMVKGLDVKAGKRNAKRNLKKLCREVYRKGCKIHKGGYNARHK